MITTTISSNLILLSIPSDFNQRVSRETEQFISKYLENIILCITNPVSFEIYSETVYDFPIIREHHDIYL